MCLAAVACARLLCPADSPLSLQARAFGWWSLWADSIAEKWLRWGTTSPTSSTWNSSSFERRPRGSMCGCRDGIQEGDTGHQVQRATTGARLARKPYTPEAGHPPWEMLVSLRLRQVWHDRKSYCAQGGIRRVAGAEEEVRRLQAVAGRWVKARGCVRACVIMLMRACAAIRK